jgi:E3 ubiquitin-protein ligase UBR1
MFLKILSAVTQELSDSKPGNDDSIRTLIDSARDSSDSSVAILTFDPFDMFVRFSFGIKLESTRDVASLLHLFYVISIVRCIVSLALPYLDGSVSSEKDESDNTPNEHGKRKRPDDTEDEKKPKSFIDMVLTYLGLSDESRNSFYSSVPLSTITFACESVCHPFLKRVCIFVLARFSVPLVKDDSEISLEELCTKLNIPSPSTLLMSSDCCGIIMPVKAWCRQLIRLHHAGKRAKLDSSMQITGPVIKFDLPITANRITLPLRFDELFEKSCVTKCDSCNTIPETPALCLICGKFLCMSAFCCTMGGIGECTRHMASCGGETGIYLLCKRGAILLLSSPLGCFARAPYLDQHGETDVCNF